MEPILGPEGRAGEPPREPFRVYTQNVYLGGDTDPLFGLDFSDAAAVVAAADAFWAEVRSSRIPERMEGIVDVLDARRPHLVGLQEAFRFLVLDPGAGGALVEAADLLASIEAAIARRGLPYELVRSQDNTTLTLPLTPRLLLRAVDRIALLRRTDVPVEAVASASYAASFPLGPATLERGWIRVRTTHEGERVHFVTTHLETQRLAAVQSRQAAELIEAVSAGLEGVTIVAGDLNSDAENPGAPSWTPTYDAMIAAGFTDLWARGTSDAGYTCCQATDVRNAASTLAQRIDFVMARGAHGLPGGGQVEVVGQAEPDRTGGGLWRSDHAGLVATLPLPRQPSRISSQTR